MIARKLAQQMWPDGEILFALAVPAVRNYEIRRTPAKAGADVSTLRLP